MQSPQSLPQRRPKSSQKKKKQHSEPQLSEEELKKLQILARNSNNVVKIITNYYEIENEFIEQEYHQVKV